MLTRLILHGAMLVKLAVLAMAGRRSAFRMAMLLADDSFPSNRERALEFVKRGYGACCAGRKGATFAARGGQVNGCAMSRGMERSGGRRLATWGRRRAAREDPCS